MFNRLRKRFFKWLAAGVIRTDPVTKEEAAELKQMIDDQVFEAIKSSKILKPKQ